MRRRSSTGREENLVWDDDGRMVEFRGGSAHQRNTFDAAGNRVVRQGANRTTIFASPFFDLEGSSQGVKHIFAGDTRVASILATYEAPLPAASPLPPARPGSAFYFHQDHLGSTAVLTDERGDVYQHLEYFPDGQVWIDSGPQQPVNGYLFSGKPFDPDTGFSDFGQRFYDPKTSLFLGTDPALTDDAGVSVGESMQLATSAYARQSPYLFIDPDGRENWKVKVVRGFVSVNSWKNKAKERFNRGVVNGAVGTWQAAVDRANRVIDKVGQPGATPSGILIEVALEDVHAQAVGLASLPRRIREDPWAAAEILGEVTFGVSVSAVMGAVGPRFFGPRGGSAPRGARGGASGRTYDPSAAGGPVRNLSTEGVRVTARGIDVVERHLARFGPDAANQGMIARLRSIAAGEMKATAADLNFYTHELREFVRYRRRGFASGAGDDYDLWNNAHSATLDDYGLVEGPGVLYHPSLDP